MDRQEEMPWIIAERPEAVVEIEPSRVVVDRIDFHRTDSEFIGKLDGSLQGIDQQETAQSLPLDGPIHGESPQQDNGNIQPRQALCIRSGKRLVDYAMRRDRVVSPHPQFTGNNGDKCPGKIATIKLSGLVPKPVVENGMPTVKS